VAEEGGLAVVRAGEEHEVEGIRVRIVEVLPYRTFRGRRMLMIAYRIIDGDFTSPVAHLWIEEGADIRPKLEELVRNYLTIRGRLRR